MRTLLAFSLLVACAGCGDGPERAESDAVPLADTASATAPATVGRLVRTEWQLVETIRDGQVRRVDSVEATLRFDGEGGLTGHGCNYYGAPVTIAPGRLDVGELGSTLIGCEGVGAEVDDAVHHVLAGAPSWQRTGHELELRRSDGSVLRYRVREPAFPARLPNVLEQSSRGGGSFRLAWGSTGGQLKVDWESQDGPGQPWGFVGLGRSVQERIEHLEPSTAQVAGDGFVFAPVPLTVARAEVVRPGRAPAPLRTHSLSTAGTWHLVSGFVGGPTRGAVVVAYDAADREVMRSRRLPS